MYSTSNNDIIITTIITCNWPRPRGPQAFLQSEEGGAREAAEPRAPISLWLTPEALLLFLFLFLLLLLLLLLLISFYQYTVHHHHHHHH